MRDCVCLVYDDDMDHGLVLVESFATTLADVIGGADVDVVAVIVVVVPKLGLMML